MSATIDTFYREAAKLGVRVTLDPSTINGEFKPMEGEILVGTKDRTLVEACIVALHELGHAHTLSPEALRSRRIWSVIPGSEGDYFVVYADELAAWSWAAAKVDPVDLPVFERIRTWALSTYADARPIAEPGSTIIAPAAAPERPRWVPERRTRATIADVFSFKR